MGHKVSPLAFRVPYIKTWKSTWYDNKKSYKDSLEMDLKVRQLLNTELKGIPLGDILINKDQESIQVVVYTAKPVLVLGKTGENKEKIENLLTRKLGKKISLEVREVKKPDINAKIVGFNIANQIEKRMPYKRAIKQAIAKAMEKGARGIKVKVGGRLNGAEIARKEMFKDGNIPTQTIRADIDYVSTRAETVYGTIGLKVWIYKGDIFKK
ncbi:30S ribosomal protein S3 [Candidatus Gracilibacteria bacterium GN02-872]|nr:30S ribosomal protein S3 [Candidatus Gracilibacteria bacterium GN02-872]RKW22020.1 MAG: 30S ribosomal protein S3 [Candidatus Gracilibacteria bacterium]